MRSYIFLFLFSSSLFASSLSDTEQSIAGYIAQEKPQQIALLEQLVNINSGTTNIDGIKSVGRILQPLFEQLGFQTRWVEEPPAMHRAPTFIAEHPGKQGKRLLLIGHLDTVFPKNSPFQRFKRQGEYATGPGIIDDKGGDVVLLYALKALHHAHALQNATITVVLTGDEEDSGKPTAISRKPLFEVAHRCDVALDFECDITQDTATVARRGISMWRIETHGKEAHSAEIFKSSVGDGAIYELSRILNAFRTNFSQDKTLSLNTGLILGGTAVNFNKQNAEGMAAGKENVIAQQAIAIGDLRFMSPDQEKEVMKRMNAIIDQHLPLTTATLLFQPGIPAMPPTPANLDLLREYSEASEALHFGPVKPLPPHLRGAGDISHIASLVPANLAGLGPLGTGAHSLQESLYIPSLTMQTQRAAIFIYRLTQKSNP